MVPLHYSFKAHVRKKWNLTIGHHLSWYGKVAAEQPERLFNRTGDGPSLKIHGPVKQKRKYQYEESHYPREQYVLSGVVAFLRGDEKTDWGLRIRDFGKVRRKIVSAAIFIFSFPIKAASCQRKQQGLTVFHFFRCNLKTIHAS